MSVGYISSIFPLQAYFAQLEGGGSYYVEYFRGVGLYLLQVELNIS